MGLRLPSESLLWLLGGVGGRCRWSTEAEEQEAGSTHQTAAKQDFQQLNNLHIHTAGRGATEQSNEDLYELMQKDLQDGLLRGPGGTKVQRVYKAAPLSYEKGEKRIQSYICCICIKTRWKIEKKLIE